MKIFYLTTEGISSTVFESQVFALKKRLELNGLHPTLVVGQKLKARISIRKLWSLFNDKSNKIIFINEKIHHQAIANKIAKFIESHNEVILHCRNMDAAYIGFLIKKQLKYKNIQVLYDVRGYLEGEAEYFNDQHLKTNIQEIHKILFGADIYYNFVSRELFDLYSNDFFINKGRVIFCNSAYDDQAFDLNNNSIINNNSINILYIGGNQSYQKIEEIINVLKNRKDISLTVVTKKRIDKKSKAENIKYLSNLTPNQINKLSDECDYGIIYRTNEMFNEVATPTKVTEYWGKGLKVIAVNSAGAYTKTILRDNRLGIIVGSENELLNIPLQKNKTL